MKNLICILLITTAAISAELSDWQTKPETIAALHPFSPTQARIVCRYPNSPECVDLAGRIAYTLDKARWRVSGRTEATKDRVRGTIAVTNSPGFTNHTAAIRSHFEGVLIFTNTVAKDSLGGQETSAVGAGAALELQLKNNGITVKTMPAPTNLPGRSVLILVGGKQ